MRWVIMEAGGGGLPVSIPGRHKTERAARAAWREYLGIRCIPAGSFVWVATVGVR